MTVCPPAVEIVNADGASRFVLTCEHASNFITSSYESLGLGAADLQRHIAWDIGAAHVARALSAMLDAPLFLSGFSRLLIDCNRPVGAPTSIPEISEMTSIPGNLNLSPAERQKRESEYYWPFQNAVSAHLDSRAQASRPSIVLGIHSFTPVFKGLVRPWHAGVLFRKSQVFGHALVEALQAPDLNVAANEPYSIGDDSDYTVPVHGEQRGLDAALIEIRQDLIASKPQARQWAARLHRALGRIG
jgi:predicted N-formylglutamate amidohydrolase